MIVPPPINEDELLDRARALAGQTLHEIALSVGRQLPQNLRHHKGFVGDLMEVVLGATAGSKAEPDFQTLGIELKTLPLDERLQPRESTYVCTVPLINHTDLQWSDSVVFHKLHHVLWIPLEAAADVPLEQRQVGLPILWSPSESEEDILQQDWEELMELISLGQIEQISAHHGKWLQIRPKAANSKALCNGIGPEGSVIRTMPRGFYLRSRFTKRLMEQYYLT